MFHFQPDKKYFNALKESKSKGDAQNTNTMSSVVLEMEAIMAVDGITKVRKAHFLKPIMNLKQQPLPNPPLLHSLTETPNINQLTKFVRVTFRGNTSFRENTSSDWNSWVDDLEKTHRSLWKKVGIFDAIRASTYNIKRDNELLIALAERWCVETNTFVFPWGEATVTLEDVMVLGGLSVLGASVKECSYKDKNLVEIEAQLKEGLSEIRNNNVCSDVSHLGVMEYFRGKGGVIEHSAFLLVWLSRCVLATGTTISKKSPVLYIAVCLARGVKIALAPAVLAFIYGELSLLKRKIVTFANEGENDTSNLYLWAPFQLVQLWGWERFRKLAPEPLGYCKGEPRLYRWQDLKKLEIQNLRSEIDSCGNTFLWRPYAVCLENWGFPKFYCENDMWVLLNSEVDEDVLSFAMCLRPCELVGLDCVEQYLPHRVGMQFGMDQDIPDFVLRSNWDYEMAWETYDKSVDGQKLYFPGRITKGHVTVRYSNWWKTALAPHPQKSERQTPLSGIEAISTEFDSSYGGLPSTNKALELGCTRLTSPVIVLDEQKELNCRRPPTGMEEIFSEFDRYHEGLQSQSMVNELGHSSPMSPVTVPNGKTDPRNIEGRLPGTVPSFREFTAPCEGLEMASEIGHATSTTMMGLDEGTEIADCSDFQADDGIRLKEINLNARSSINNLHGNHSINESVLVSVEARSDNQLPSGLGSDQSCSLEAAVDEQMLTSIPLDDVVMVGGDNEAANNIVSFLIGIFELEEKVSRMERRVCVIKGTVSRYM